MAVRVHGPRGDPGIPDRSPLERGERLPGKAPEPDCPRGAGRCPQVLRTWARKGAWRPHAAHGRALAGRQLTPPCGRPGGFGGAGVRRDGLQRKETCKRLFICPTSQAVAPPGSGALIPACCPRPRPGHETTPRPPAPARGPLGPPLRPRRMALQAPQRVGDWRCAGRALGPPLASRGLLLAVQWGRGGR